jgi:hypothetical protein
MNNFWIGRREIFFGSLISVLFTFCLAPIARSEDTNDQINDNYKYVKQRLDDQEDYIVKLLGQVTELEKTKGDDDSALSHLKDLREMLNKQREDVQGLSASAQKLKDEADSREKKTDADIAALSEKLQAMVEQVNESGKVTRQSGDEIDKFKYLTRMKVYPFRREYHIELEAVDGAKILPLGGKKVEVLEQVKDGTPTPMDAVVTDDRGVVVVDRPETTDDDAHGLYLVFRLSADDAYRGCLVRILIKQ